MVKLLLVLTSFLFLATSALADTVTFSFPDGATAVNGEVVTSIGEVTSIAISDPNKIVKTNGNKFVIYGLNQLAIAGGLEVTITRDPKLEGDVYLTDVVVSDSIAQPLLYIVETVKLYSSFDLNNDGLIDVNDVILAIDVIFNGNLVATDLQAIINKVLEEM
jgi:hypothetical protein